MQVADRTRPGRTWGELPRRPYVTKRPRVNTFAYPSRVFRPGPGAKSTTCTVVRAPTVFRASPFPLGPYSRGAGVVVRPPNRGCRPVSFWASSPFSSIGIQPPVEVLPARPQVIRRRLNPPAFRVNRLPKQAPAPSGCRSCDIPDRTACGLIPPPSRQPRLPERPSDSTMNAESERKRRQ